MTQDALSIGEVAQRSGFPASTLRYYEEIGLLTPPSREGGRRRYDPEVLERLRVIDLGRAAGFTLDELRTLLDGFAARTPASRRWRRLGAAKLAELDAQAARIEAMRTTLHHLLTCECRRLSDCAALAQESPRPGGGAV